MSGVTAEMRSFLSTAISSYPRRESPGDERALMADDSVRRLTPEQVATDLFTILVDRDQRASAVCAETLLTLAANDYGAPADSLIVSPKRQRFAIRSLALGEN